MFDRLRVLFYYLIQRHARGFRTRARLEAWQQRRLRKQLRYISLRSPFYRERLDQGWAAMAPVDKAQMMTNFDRLNTRGLSRDEVTALALRAERSRDFTPMADDVTIGLSSGTSGHRGLFCADHGERLRYAGTILAKALPAGGLARSHRVAFFMRANSNLYETTQSRRLRFRFFDLLTPFAEHLEELRALKPTLVVAPPSLLRVMGEAILAGRLSAEGLARVYSVAEVLDPADEDFLRRAFGRRIDQIYQCTEGFLGITCAHGSLHLNEDLAIIEKDWIDEKAGKFAPVITDLYRRTQPIVRYRLNDILTEDPRPCPCGSALTRLAMIEGRQDDMIEFPARGGWRPVFPDFVRNAILYASAEIEEYAVVQELDRSLTIALKTRREGAGVEARVRNAISDLARRLACDAPELRFGPIEAPPAGAKLRRITRRRSDVHPPS